MTIYEIKRRSKEKKPYYFSKDTMRFFNQTLKDFKVCKIDGFNNIYMFWAKSWDNNITQAYFDAITNDINNDLNTLINGRKKKND
jgi:hypothetical protein